MSQRSILTIACSMLLSSTAVVVSPAGLTQDKAQGTTGAVARNGCGHDNAGLTLPAGFCASVFADNLGPERLQRMMKAHGFGPEHTADQYHVELLRDLAEPLTAARCRLGVHKGPAAVVVGGCGFFHHRGDCRRTFVSLHGGTIHADSAGSGHGTRITVTLPLALEAVVRDPPS